MVLESDTEREEAELQRRMVTKRCANENTRPQKGVELGVPHQWERRTKTLDPRRGAHRLERGTKHSS